MRNLPISLHRSSLMVLTLSTVAACGSSPTENESTGTSSEDVTIQELRGVDSAAAFGATDAKKLRDDHDVRWTGVYIGGKCSGGSGWHRDVVKSMYDAAKWGFMPTYVGQEAASSCNGSDPVLTYGQGKSDGEHAADIMVNFGWDAKRDIPVALDIEQDTYQSDPRGTVDYVRGWVDSVRSNGYVPYVYGNPDAINDFASRKLDIGAAWVASYFYSGFENVTPYDLKQIGKNFSRHDRAWQYAGGVDIPSLGIQVDCNASDLLLAPAPGGTNLAPESLGDKIVHLATINLDKGACSKNSEGGRGYDSSCTGNGGEPEYWCADFARWVWARAGVADTSRLTAAAGSFYEYGQDHRTLHSEPAVGDAVVFNYQGGGVADHVAIVSRVNSDDTIETISGDWGGEPGSEAHFASTSHVDLNKPAYGDRVGSDPGVMGMKISGYVSPVKP